MKIRHKQSGVELEGEFCDCAHSGTGIPSRSYFSDIHSESLYDKVCWEAVPEWVDVTGACEVLQGIRLWHGEKAIADLSNGYRLRKVGVEWFSGVPLGLAKSGWAFIVERKA